MVFVLTLLLNAAIILLVAKMLPAVIIRDFKTALVVALVIGLLNATIGFLLRLPLNLVTLFLLTFIVRLFVTAIVIKIASALFKGFEVKTFTAALVLALAMAVAGAIMERMLNREKEYQQQYRGVAYVNDEKKTPLQHGNSILPFSDY